MKQLTKSLLKMSFTDIDLNNVSQIEFAFSQEIEAAPLKTATYPSDGVVKLTDTVLGVAWTQEETQLFVAGKPFYADTRITLADSEYQPETPILKLMMNPTLFRKES